MHEDIGYGTSKDNDQGQAIERAKKAAVTDARKRALRCFGEFLGNSLKHKDDHSKALNNVNSDNSEYLSSSSSSSSSHSHHDSSSSTSAAINSKTKFESSTALPQSAPKYKKPLTPQSTNSVNNRQSQQQVFQQPQQPQFDQQKIREKKEAAKKILRDRQQMQQRKAAERAADTSNFGSRSEAKRSPDAGGQIDSIHYQQPRLQHQPLANRNQMKPSIINHNLGNAPSNKIVGTIGLQPATQLFVSRNASEKSPNSDENLQEKSIGLLSNPSANTQFPYSLETETPDGKFLDAASDIGGKHNQGDSIQIHNSTVELSASDVAALEEYESRQHQSDKRQKVA